MLPWPSWLSTQIRPLCLNTSSLAINSPSPSPLRLASTVLFTWARRLKMTSWLSGLIPHPVSDTDKHRKSSFAEKGRFETVTLPPSGVNLIPLSTRLVRICRTRTGSAQMKGRSFAISDRRSIFFTAAFVRHAPRTSAISLVGLACRGSTMSLWVATRVTSSRSLTIPFNCWTFSSANVRCSCCSGVSSPRSPSNTFVV